MSKTPQTEAQRLADEYADATSTHRLESLYGTSKSYTAEKARERDEAHAKLSAELRRLDAIAQRHIEMMANPCPEWDGKAYMQAIANLRAQFERPAAPAAPDVMSILRAIHRRPSDAGIWLDDITRILRDAPAPAVPQGEPEAYMVHGNYTRQPFRSIESAQAYMGGLLKSDPEGGYHIRPLFYATPAAPSQPVNRPQNCGTSFCSCIECVCEPESVTLTDAVKALDDLQSAFMSHTQWNGTPPSEVIAARAIIAALREKGALRGEPPTTARAALTSSAPNGTP